MRPVLPVARLALLGCLAALASCGELGGSIKPPHDKPEPVVNRPAADAEAARGYVAALGELQSASPAAQAELFGEVATEGTRNKEQRLAILDRFVELTV